jgi:hypothetical protein
VLYVVLELFAKRNTIHLSATALLVWKEMQELLVLRLNAQLMLTVLTMKNVTIQEEAKVKSVYLSVLSPSALLEPFVQQITTRKSVSASYL